MNTRWTILGLLALVLLIGVTPKVQADDGMYSYNYGAPWWDYSSGGYFGERLPYYALYPPVYYSHPVPRTYGYSPFAYPPGVETPEVQASRSVESTTAQRRPPLRIINPYVTRAEEVPPPKPWQ